jgi:hypothetical protein
MVLWLMAATKTTSDWPLFCARCSCELRPGSGDFFLVRIEAVADPTPPNVREEDLRGDIQGEIKKLIEQMEHISATEAMDQVHRRLTLYMCGPCYRQWIEDPAGGHRQG